MRPPLLAALISRRRVAFALLLFASGSVGHADTAQRFVDRLREAGHTDLVLEYLDRAATDPLVSDAFRDRVPAERLRTLAEAARKTADPDRRLSAWREVEQRLEVASGVDAVSLSTDVADGVATTLATVARRAVAKAKLATDRRDQQRENQAARAALAAARESLGEAERRIVAEREPLKGVQPNSVEGRRRADLGERLALIRLQSAQALLELAETYPAGDKQRERFLKQAAEALGEHYEKYQRWIVGLLAHLYEGRAYRLLGEKQLALAALEDLIAQPADRPDLRELKTQAYAERVALWVAEGDPQKAVESAEDWLDGLNAAESAGRAGAILQYELAVAAMAAAGPSSDRSLMRRAREWLTVAARAAIPQRRDARALLGQVNEKLGLSGKQPETFADAFQAGREAIERVAAAPAAEASTDATALDREAAYQSLRTALRLVDAETEAAQVDQARYWLAYLDWLAGREHRAAVRAEYVARAETEGTAQEAARLAMAAYDRLARETESNAYADALGRFASYVAGRWPGEPVAQAASFVIVTAALRSGDAEAAERAIKAAPIGQQPELRLRLALARYDAADSADRAVALDALRQSLVEAERTGVSASLRSVAGLRLASSALADGDRVAARETLGDSDDGTLSVAVSGEDAATAKLSLRLAIRAWADKPARASRYVERLADRLGEGEAASREWLATALELRRDLDAASSREPRSAIAATLALVSPWLDGSAESGDWNTRLWIAQTRLRASELVGDDSTRSDLLQAARATLEDLIASADRDSGFAPNATSVLAARLRLAECQRVAGDHPAAFATLVTMLEKRPVMLDVQRAAADTLAQWGRSSGDSAKLEEAIAGARPATGGKNLVWGYSKLAAIAARAAASDPARMPLFFEAWQGVARSRYEAAMLATGDDRGQQLRKAANTIRALKRQHPDLGGGAQLDEFEALLAKIEQAAASGGFWTN